MKEDLFKKNISPYICTPKNKEHLCKKEKDR